MASHPVQTAYDDADPHHESHHHGHVIVQPRTLIAVLVALLAFTVLTVFASRFEVWFAEKFHVEIPNIVNILVCLSIASVKGALVAMFFMQLKYDSALNTVIFLFCLFALVLFLFFSMTDLGTRAAIYPYKSGEIQKGGMGIDASKIGGGNTGSDGIVAWAKKARIELISERHAQGTLVPPLAPGETAEMRWAVEAAKMRHTHEDHAPVVSTANRHHKPAPGPTPNLYTPDAELQKHDDGHGH